MNPTLFLVVAAGLVLVLVVLLVLRKISRVAFIALAVVVALVGGLMAAKISQFKAMGGAKWAPASLGRHDRQRHGGGLGAHPAVPRGPSWRCKGVTVAAQLDGNVARIAFAAGSTVRAATCCSSRT